MTAAVRKTISYLCQSLAVLELEGVLSSPGVGTGRLWDSHVQVNGLTIRSTRSARYQLTLENSGERSFFLTA